DQDIAGLDQRVEYFLALGLLGVERDGTLVVVEHREVQAVGGRDVSQLTPRRVAFTCTFDLYHIGTEPRQQLRASGAGLHMREIEYPNTLECLAHQLSPFALAPSNLASASLASD